MIKMILVLTVIWLISILENRDAYMKDSDQNNQAVDTFLNSLQINENFISVLESRTIYIALGITINIIKGKLFFKIRQIIPLGYLTKWFVYLG